MKLDDLHKLFSKTYFIGIDIEYGTSGTFRATLCLLKKHKTDLEQIANPSFDSFSDLLGYLNQYKDCPVYINLRGSGVFEDLYTTEKPPSPSKELLFYEYVVAGTTLRAMARIAHVASIIAKFTQHEIYVLGVHLGPNLSPIHSVISNANLILGSRVALCVKDYIYDLQEVNGEVAAGNKPFIEIKEQKFSPSSAFAFASALSLVYANQSDAKELKIITDNKLQYRFKNKYLNSLKILVAVSFSVLLVNYILFSKYHNANKQLNGKIAISKNELIQVAKNKAELKSQKQFAKRNALAQPSLMAYRADQLALLLPTNTYLIALEYAPKMKAKKSKETIFKSNTIQLTGKTNKSIHIESYIKQIEKLEWIERVALESVVPIEKTAQLQFSLNIRIAAL